jgi:hypothetical protein
MAGTSPAMTKLLKSKDIAIPGVVPGIHGDTVGTHVSAEFTFFFRSLLV